MKVKDLVTMLSKYDSEDEVLITMDDSESVSAGAPVGIMAVQRNDKTWLFVEDGQSRASDTAKPFRAVLLRPEGGS